MQYHEIMEDIINVMLANGLQLNHLMDEDIHNICQGVLDIKSVKVGNITIDASTISYIVLRHSEELHPVLHARGCSVT